MRPWTRWLMLTALPLLGACTSFADADLGTTSAGGQAGVAGSGGSVGGSSGQSGAAGSAQGGPGGSAGQGGTSGASGQSGAAGSAAGQSGAAGSAGAAGSGGQGGSAGKGGDTGVGGAAGVGGAGAGGSGGASGDAGTSGSGGGGAGGSAGSGGSSAGGSAGSGAGGSGGSPGGASGSAGAGGSEVGGASGSSGQGGAGPVCGDGACDGGEDSDVCPVDCPAVCGNGKCEVAEDACKCAIDCGQPQCGECGSPCGNGLCDCGESNASCPSDCPGVCGNGKIEAGEECDGFITVDCDGFLKNGGFGGSPVCGNDCKVDLSACEYCGNGQLDPSETCDGSVSMSCSTLGAGNGNLSCKGCQLDTSGCSLLSCGYRTGLSLNGWPIEGGCTRRPNQSNSTGPLVTTPYVQFPSGAGSSFSPQLATAKGESFIQGINGVFRLNDAGFVEINGFVNISSQSLVVTASGDFFRVSNNSVATFEISNEQANPKSNNMLSGLPTLAPVMFENSVAYFGKEGGKLYRLSQNGSPNNVYTAPSELGGTMAYDHQEGQIYFASTCADTGCQVYARPIAANAAIAWTAPIGGPSTEGIVPGCHVAIGADSTVYTTCGSSIRRINPSNPQSYIDGFNLSLETRISPPTLAASGIIYVATRQASASQTGTLIALSPQLKILWTRNLEGAPLGAPLLDRDGNLYLCQSQSINSYSPDGTPRWSYAFDNAQACAISLDQGVLDVVTSKEAFRFK